MGAPMVENSPNSLSNPFGGLRQRLIFALALMALALTCTIAGGFVFALLVLCAALQMIREWDRLTEHDGLYWRVAGIAYVALPCASLLWLRGYTAYSTGDEPYDSGLAQILYLFLVIWATDTGAYFTGRAIGGIKLAPTISPGKTWAGLGGGMVAAGVTGGLFSFYAPYPASFGLAIVISMLLAIVAQTGDLFESWLKRRAGVKDSGNLIPGHGGILDRVDGLTFTAPLLVLLIYFAS